MAITRYIHDDKTSFVFLGVRQDKSEGIIPIITVIVAMERKDLKVNEALQVDYYEVGILQSQAAYSIVRNNHTLTNSYYPDAGKEKCSMPVDIFQQVMRVLTLKG